MWLDQASLAELYLAAVFALPERRLERNGENESDMNVFYFKFWRQGQQSHMNTCMNKCARERWETNQPIGHPWHLISLVYAQLRCDLDNYWVACQGSFLLRSLSLSLCTFFSLLPSLPNVSNQESRISIYLILNLLFYLFFFQRKRDECRRTRRKKTNHRWQKIIYVIRKEEKEKEGDVRNYYLGNKTCTQIKYECVLFYERKGTVFKRWVLVCLVWVFQLNQGQLDWTG